MGIRGARDRAANSAWLALGALAMMQAISPVSAQSTDITAKAVGGQSIVTERSGPMAFAGTTLELNGFTGMLGYASQVAYVVVIEGEARAGDQHARPGQMLLLPPMGAAPIVQRFDAARLHRTVQDGALPPAAMARLQALSTQQKRGLFLGRLTRTRLNITAPGDADQELARRSVVDMPTVRAIRFSSDREPQGVERRLVMAFLDALKMRDEPAVAALMDPVPFGNTDLRGDATDARRIMARTLIASRDWPALLADVVPAVTAGGSEWSLASPSALGLMTTRRMDGFVFVSTIEMGAK